MSTEGAAGNPLWMPVRCIIGFTGTPLYIRVVPQPLPSPRGPDPAKRDRDKSEERRELSGSSSTATLTVRDLVQCAAKQLFSSAVDVRVFYWPSMQPMLDTQPIPASLCHTAGLEPAAGSPRTATREEMYLFFDPKLLPKVPVAEAASHDAPAQSEIYRRQVAAEEMLKLPLQNYYSRAELDAEQLKTELEDVERELQQLDMELPKLMDPLQAIRLPSDPNMKLVEVIDIDKRIKIAKDTVHAIRSSVATRTISLQGHRATLAARATAATGRDPNDMPPPASPKAFTSKLTQQWQDMKLFIRAIDEERKTIQKERQQIKLVRSGALSRVDLLKELPDGFRRANEVAMKRLTFFRAANRVHTVLAMKAMELQSEVEQFINDWGRRFPSNVFPGITNPVSAGMPPVDPLAFSLQASVTDIDDDSASMLLEELGLAGTGQPYSSRRREEKESERTTLLEQVLQLRKREKDLDAEVEKLQKDYQDLLKSTKEREEQQLKRIDELEKQNQSSEALIQGLRGILEEGRGDGGGGGSPAALKEPSESAASCGGSAPPPVGLALTILNNQRLAFVKVTGSVFVHHHLRTQTTLLLSRECAVKISHARPTLRQGDVVWCSVIFAEPNPEENAARIVTVMAAIAE